MSHSNNKTMKVLVVESGKAPYAAEIPAGLESLQHMVGDSYRLYTPFVTPMLR